MKQFRKALSDLLRGTPSSAPVETPRTKITPTPKSAFPDHGPQPIWTPTHRHRKGGLYRVLAEGICEAGRNPVIIYDDAEGTIWVRSAEEFQDGRFKEI
jgi:hypothetical protein